MRTCRTRVAQNRYSYHARGRLRYTAWQDERSSRTFVHWARKRKAAVRGTGWNRSFVTADCESTFSSTWHYLHVAHIFTSFSMHPKIVSYSTRITSRMIQRSAYKCARTDVHVRFQTLCTYVSYPCSLPTLQGTVPRAPCRNVQIPSNSICT